jgi:hypothetical protein
MKKKTKSAFILLPICASLFALPAWARQPFLEFSVVSCDTRPKYSTAQMGVKNLNEKTIESVEIKYNIFDEKNKIFRSDSWFFEGIRQGKTVVDRVLAMDSISCGEISSIEVVSAGCRFAGEKGKYDCYDAIKPMPGALKVKK